MSRWHDFVDDHPRAAGALTRLRSVLPPLNFITLHYVYFIIVPLIVSVIFWGSSQPAHSISYVDSLFLVTSAMTEAGLNTVNLSTMTTWQQIILFLLIMVGSTIWVSIATVLARKHVFEQRFKDIVRSNRFHHSSTFGLPVLQQFNSFRRVHSVPAGDTPLPGTGSRVPTQLPSPALGHAGQPPLQPPAVNREASGVEPPATPTSQAGHIAFVESPRPDAAAIETSHGITTSSSQPHDGQNQPSRRHNGTAVDGQEGHQHDEKSSHFGMRHFLAHRNAGRNAQFHDLTAEEREVLGGCEYRALKVLAVIVPTYFFLWQVLGCLALGAWMHNNLPEPALQNGINPWWLGIFNGASAFNNSGMSLLDANMIPFESAYFVLITMGLMILAGNTAYPIFLRLIMWSALKVLKLTTAESEYSDIKDTFQFILKYPRRVYTNLFPARATWWLVFMLVCLNSVDWVAFELLNIGNPVIENIPKGSRVLDGLFQALAVRSGGFYVVPISQVYIGLQVLYVIMMYISVYPVVITMRNSNVYEERSLGIYADAASSDTSSESDVAVPGRDLRLRATQSDVLPAESGDFPSISPRSPQRPLSRRLSSIPAAELGRAVRRTLTRWHGVGVPPPLPEDVQRAGASESRISFITQQIHGQLAHDIWWLVVAVLVITTIETSHFIGDPVTYSVFNVIFEVVSAYGCVGISVGLPNQAYSFAGGWHAPSKIVLCLVMLRGRHRGLPVALDRAVRLPGEQLQRDEDDDYRIRRSMTSRRVSGDY
ncbi:TrkH-domain-containing protein [Coniochaeta ligniaria NRRL 30616]|uniref:Potassium transport protein n=1 Tax=Coniochaeta ligniaria NRRL 30616 TaxID=1408157 RepID=A0A1J7IY44_9PEZI|nr:TrkH-domain-containing protein [Coniochaeta ligniaria NRRL 30616]